jgi:hypothetical protein
MQLMELSSNEKKQFRSDNAISIDLWELDHFGAMTQQSI